MKDASKNLSAIAIKLMKQPNAMIKIPMRLHFVRSISSAYVGVVAAMAPKAQQTTPNPAVTSTRSSKPQRYPEPKHVEINLRRIDLHGVITHPRSSA
jgi:hypothetical protein